MAELPRIAYILLWFPKPSETFIFREVMNLWKMGLPLNVYALYGELKKHLSPEMQSVTHRVKRLGILYLKDVIREVLYWLHRDRATVIGLFRQVPIRPWRSLEVAGENLWAFLAGFKMARLFEQDRIDHIHAPWANGPATAAWVASELTGIPFSFTGRAVDIFPPDGALKEKINHCSFVRTNPNVNVEHLRQFAGSEADKIHVVYDGYPLRVFQNAPVNMRPPFRILAIGRFARFKGFDVLIRAAGIMKDFGLNFQITLAGSGVRGVFLKGLAHRLGVRKHIRFPGYVTHEKVTELFQKADVFVVPSIIHKTGERDGIPNVMVEALLHRLPVVATDVAGIGEVIRDGETGFLVRQKDPKVLADAILRMTRDRTAALKIAERGRQFVLCKFDPETCHREVFKLFIEAPRKQKSIRNVSDDG